MSEGKPGVGPLLLKLYRKYRKQGLKHRQAYERAEEELSAPKEKSEQRKKERKANKRR